MRLAFPLAATALLVAVAALAALPAAGAEPCATYGPLGMPKTRTCVNPDRVPGCPVSSETWSNVGYFHTCYGTDHWLLENVCLVECLVLP